MKRILLVLALLILAACSAPQAEPVDLDDPFLGPEDADIVIVEYSDFQCPFCGAAAGLNDQLINQFKSQSPSWEPAVPELKRLAEEGKLKIVYKHYPVQGHQFAQNAAEAAEAANAQGMFWEYHDVIFANQGQLRDADLIRYARELGLDMDRFESEFRGNAYEASVRKDYAEGVRAGVTGTPSFFVNGEIVEGAQPWSVFESILVEQGLELEE